MCVNPAKSWRDDESGAATIIIVVGVIVILIVLGLTAATALKWSAGPGPVTTERHVGSLSAPTPFPATVSAPTNVTYHVTKVKESRPSGAGSAYPATPISTSDVEDALITFTLAVGNATFDDGSTIKQVETGADGKATVSIIAATDGVDTLRFAMTIGKGIFSNGVTVGDPIEEVFEVVRSP